VSTATRLHDAISEPARFNDYPDAGGIDVRDSDLPARTQVVDDVLADLERGVRVLAGTLARFAA
jgi:hypothetical protein